MEEGYVLDRGHMNTANPLMWIAGQWTPQTLKERMFTDPLKGKQHRPISSYRCVRCGYLEIYAK